MKRYFVLVVGACALALALAAGPALAGTPQPSPVGGLAQTLDNQTSQQNNAVSTNAPVLSGNSVALINDGDQSSSAGTDQKQVNGNSTDQTASQSSPGNSGQPSGSEAGKGPSKGGDSLDQDVSNQTNQQNDAVSTNAPVLSGNSVALVNGGGCGCDSGEGGNQTSSAGTEQTQVNRNSTDQTANQSGAGKGKGREDQDVSNETSQQNNAVSTNAPVLSGNSVALINEGDQSSSAGTSQTQVNRNSTTQTATQSGSGRSDSWDESCRCKGGRSQDVSNETSQQNNAVSTNAPVLSGNSVALINEGDQSSSAGTSQTQVNRNSTTQDASQSQSKSGPKPCPKPEPKPCEPKPCPKPEPKPCEPKPCPKPEPKPCEPKPCPKPEPKPCEPKPCPKPEPKPCEPKPCPPTPCKAGAGDMLGSVTGSVKHLV